MTHLRKYKQNKTEFIKIYISAEMNIINKAKSENN